MKAGIAWHIVIVAMCVATILANLDIPKSVTLALLPNRSTLLLERSQWMNPLE